MLVRRRFALRSCLHQLHAYAEYRRVKAAQRATMMLKVGLAAVVSSLDCTQGLDGLAAVRRRQLLRAWHLHWMDAVIVRSRWARAGDHHTTQVCRGVVLAWRAFALHAQRCKHMERR